MTEEGLRRSRRLATWVPRLLGTALLIAGCLPSYSVTRQGDRQTTRISVGVPFSPWILFVREAGVQDGNPQNFPASFEQRASVQLLSWSVLLLFLAQAMFFVAAVSARGSR